MAWLLDMLISGVGGPGSPFQIPQQPEPTASFPGNILGPLVQGTNKKSGIFGFQKKSIPQFSPNDIRQPVLHQPGVQHTSKRTIDIGRLPGGSPTGPQDRVFIDTGKDFDRFLVHRLRGVDAFGIPLFNRWNSQGAVWKNGDVEIVDSDGDDILGGSISSRDKGFNIPIGTIFNAVNTLGKLGQKKAPTRFPRNTL